MHGRNVARTPHLTPVPTLEPLPGGTTWRWLGSVFPPITNSFGFLRPTSLKLSLAIALVRLDPFSMADTETWNVETLR